MPDYTGQHTRYDADAYDAMIDEAWHPHIGPHRRVIASGRDVTTWPFARWPHYAVNLYATGWRPWFYDNELVPEGVEPGRILRT